MQVDSRNFEDHVDLILKEIQHAHFISFDCEFTGLVTQTVQIQGLYPDHRQFYERIKETALNFNLLQFGITLFHFDNGEYFPKSYNFYMSASHKPHFNKVFLSEWDSMRFLSQNGMNFNQVFQYGIPFKRIGQKMPKEANFEPLMKKNAKHQTFFSKEDQEIIQVIEKDVGKEGKRRINFRSKRIFDFMRSKYDFSFQKGKNMEKFEYSCKMTPKHEDFFEEEMGSKQMEETGKKMQEVSQFVEACKQIDDISLDEKKHTNVQERRTLEVILEQIIQTGKPIVGHFPSLDIGLIYQAFLDDLPQNFEEFSNHINKLFPYIFDTKVISTRVQQKGKISRIDLKSIYKAIFNPRILQPFSNINFKYVEKYLHSESSHQAGYDSYMTGCAFIAMLNCLYDVKKELFVFSRAAAENNTLYSKFAGEVSLMGPDYSANTRENDQRIVIFGGLMKDHNWKELGQKLSLYGTLTVVEDHGETYYVFDGYQATKKILEQVQGVKRYEKRALIPARQLFG